MEVSIGLVLMNVLANIASRVQSQLARGRH